MTAQRQVTGVIGLPTAVTGWPATTVSVASGQALASAVRVQTGSGYTARPVQVQRRLSTATTWSTVAVGSTDSLGTYTATYAPSSVGTWYFRLNVPATVTAAAATSAQRQVNASRPAPQVTSTLPDGTAGASYLAVLTATGGIAPYTWTATGLPTGLTIAADGSITGTPAATGTSAVTVTVTDVAGTPTAATLSLKVPTSLPSACHDASCAFLTPDGATKQVPATDISTLTLDPSTGAITGATLTGTTVTAGDVLVLAPTATNPSGAIGIAGDPTSNPDGSITVPLTPGTLDDAYAEGIVHTVTPDLSQSNTTASAGGAPGTSSATRAQSPSSLATSSGSSLTCTGGATATFTALSATPTVTPQLTALWKHPFFGGGGVYVGTGGLSLFQTSVDASLTLTAGVSVSGSSHCTYAFPTIKQVFPAGNLGAVVVLASPSVSLDVSGKVEATVSVTYECSTLYRWDNGSESRVSYCRAKNQPLQLSSDSGVTATFAASIAVTTTLNGGPGLKGSLTPSLTATYTPLSQPIAALTGKVDANLTACLACLFKGAPSNITLYNGTLWGPKTLATYSTATQVAAAPPVISSTALPNGQVGVPYSAPLTTADNRNGAWSVTGLPPGLTQSGNTITGTPTTAGTWLATIRFTDAAGRVGAASTSLRVWTNRPTTTGTISTAVALSSNDYQTCALTSVGGVKCWGFNGSGQLGDGSLQDSAIPVNVVGLTSGVKSIAAGAEHTCAVTTSGGVKCWGYNGEGELGDGFTDLVSVTPVDVVGLSSGVQTVSAGWDYTCALTTAGGVTCWGANPDGELGDGSTTGSATPVNVVGLTSGVKSISAGYHSACAVTTAGALKCWGANESGQLGNDSFTQSSVPVDVVGLTSGVASVSVGLDSTACAVTTAGGVKCWGANSYGQLGSGSTSPSTTPVDVVGLSSGVQAVSVGVLHTCAATSAGGVKCWGYSGDGELGNGSTTASAVPVDVARSTSGVRAVSAGAFHACALTTAGRVACWGSNSSGQLGAGTSTDSATPVDVVGF
ncbi:RCC1 domain-containing protein [Terrabacter sp. 2RAF25]|uniref:RCC1 domain-containing protein n=1 Tax=Terrabacter sp. 2RAF25 TaxID=3232998 RepID=UPI003F9AE97A